MSVEQVVVVIALSLSLVAILIGAYLLGRSKSLDHRLRQVEDEMSLLSKTITENVKEQLDSFQKSLPEKVAIQVAIKLGEALTAVKENDHLVAIGQQLRRVR